MLFTIWNFLLSCLPASLPGLKSFIFGVLVLVTQMLQRIMNDTCSPTSQGEKGELATLSFQHASISGTLQHNCEKNISEVRGKLSLNILLYGIIYNIQCKASN